MEKLRNTLRLDYPVDRLKVIVVTDGSDDQTPDLVRAFPSVILLHAPERKGKAAAINRAVLFSGNAEVLVFSDANTLINPGALLSIVARYADPTIGGVSGEKKVSSGGADGFDAHRALMNVVKMHLSEGGAVFIEIGVGQLPAMRRLVQNSGVALSRT